MASWNETERRRAREGMPRLLAGKDRLTRLEKEEILAGVMDRVAGGRAPSRRWPYVLAAACAVAALALAVPLLRRDGLAPRGAGAGGTDFQTYCTLDGRRAPCRNGAKLLFELSATTERRFFAAFARRQDGTVIWYFPGDELERSLDAAGQEHGVASRGFLLGPEHPPGRYRVYGLFSARPLTRQEVRSRVEEATREEDLVEKTLVVEERP